MYRLLLCFLFVLMPLSAIPWQVHAVDMNEIAPMKMSHRLKVRAQSKHFELRTRKTRYDEATCNPHQEYGRHIGGLITTDKSDNFDKYAQELQKLIKEGFQKTVELCTKSRNSFQRGRSAQSKQTPPLDTLHLYAYAADKPRYVVRGFSAKNQENRLNITEFYNLAKSAKTFNGQPIGSCSNAEASPTGNIGLLFSGPYKIEKSSTHFSIGTAWKIEQICNSAIHSINPAIKQGALVKEMTLYGNVEKDRVFLSSKQQRLEKELSKSAIIRHQGELKLTLFKPHRSIKHDITVGIYEMKVNLDQAVLAQNKKKADAKLAKANQLKQTKRTQAVTGKAYYEKHFKHNQFRYTRKEQPADKLKNIAIDQQTAQQLASRDGKKSHIVLTPHARSFAPIKSKGRMYSADDIVTLFNYELFRTQHHSKYVARDDVIAKSKLFSDDNGQVYVASLLSPWRDYRYGVFTIEQFSQEDLQRYAEFNKVSLYWASDLYDQQKKIGYNLECMMFDAISLASEALGCDSISGFLPARLAKMLKESKVPALDSYFQHGRSSGYAFEFSTTGQYIFESPLKDIKAHEIRIPLPSQSKSQTPMHRFRPRELNTSSAYWKRTKTAYLEAFRTQLAKATDTVYIDEATWQQKTGSTFFHRYLEGVSGRNPQDFKYITDYTISILASYYTVKYAQCPASFNKSPKEYQFGILTTVTTKDGYGWIYDKSYKTEYDDKFYIDRKLAPLFDKHLAIKRKHVSKTWRPNTFHATEAEKQIFNEAKRLFKTFGCDSEVVSQIEENMYRDLALMPSIQEARFPVSTKL